MNFNLQTSQIDLGSLWFQKCAYPLPRSTFANDCAPEIFKHFPPIERDNISHTDVRLLIAVKGEGNNRATVVTNT